MSGAAAAEIGEAKEPKPLGSLASWAKQNGIDPKDSETLSAYTVELGKYNQQRATWLGITVEELHGLPSEEVAVEMEETARTRDRKAEQQAAAGSMAGRAATRSGQTPSIEHHQV